MAKQSNNYSDRIGRVLGAGGSAVTTAILQVLDGANSLQMKALENLINATTYVGEDGRLFAKTIPFTEKYKVGGHTVEFERSLPIITLFTRMLMPKSFVVDASFTIETNYVTKESLNTDTTIGAKGKAEIKVPVVPISVGLEVDVQSKIATAKERSKDERLASVVNFRFEAESMPSDMIEVLKDQAIDTGKRFTDAQLTQVFSALNAKLSNDNQPTIDGASKTADAPKEAEEVDKAI